MTLTVTHAKVTSGTTNNDVEVDLADWNDAHTVSGNLPVSQLDSGTGASASTYWRGDGTWAAASPTPAALTRVDDTNVTLTLAGAPTTALLAATSVTVGWTGTLAVSRGGTGISAFGTGVASALGINVGSAGAFVVNGGALGTPSSGTLTSATGLPLSTGITGAGTGVLAALAVNVGSAGAFVTFNGALGTPSSGTLTNCTGLPVAGGGTGLATATAYAVVCGGTTGTGAFQSIASVGTSGHVLTSNGAGALPTFQAAAGGTATYFAPQGRLTLQTGTPVMTTTQSAKTTIYYTPYVGDMVPIYDGADMVPTAVAEISVATTDTTKSPAAIGASKMNDWFIWNDSGTIRLGHGPDWTSDSARSAGTALVMVNGIYLNNATITNGPAASRGTYVGTTRSNSSSQLDWIFGAIAASGTAALFGVFNAYNSVHVSTLIGDTTSSWTYNSTWRSANNSATMRASYVVGLVGNAYSAAYTMHAKAAAAGSSALVGIGYDVTNALSGISGANDGTTFIAATASYTTLSAIGFHFMQAIEQSGAVATYYGNPATGFQSGMTFNGSM